MELSKSDYYYGIPKCIQYRKLAEKGDFSNPFYLIPSEPRRDTVGAVYEIFGGCWTLQIDSYDSATGVLVGHPKFSPEQEPLEFMAIPLSEGIKGVYKFGSSADAFNLNRLYKLARL